MFTFHIVGVYMLVFSINIRGLFSRERGKNIYLHIIFLKLHLKNYNLVIQNILMEMYPMKKIPTDNRKLFSACWIPIGFNVLNIGPFKEVS